MKKTAKFLTLAAGVLLLFTGTTKAEGFDVGVDVVSRYVWRGVQYGDGVAAQPWVSYTFPGAGVEVGAWGSYDLSDDDANEADLYLTVPIGENFSLTITDYYFPSGGADNYFDWGDDGDHIVELAGGLEIDNFSLLGAINVLGNDDENSVYFEAGYQFYDKDDYTGSVFVGAGNEIYTSTTDFEVVNVGVTVSKDMFWASYIVNPDLENSNLVVGISLQP